MRVAQRAVIAVTLRADAREPNIPASRRSTDLMERSFRLARGVSVVADTVAGVPVRRFSSGGHTPGVVLHLHGGAYYCGSSRMGRRYSRIVADGGPDMVSVDYRLAPEHPYPAGLDDAFAVYAALCGQPIVITGDSAGGGLALALTQRVRDAGLPMPVGLAPIFPWADLTQSGESYAANAGRDMLTKAGLDWAAGLYIAGGDPLTPGISPLFGVFDDFPPTFITVGTGDSLLDDARRVTAALRAAGVEVTLREIPGALHGFAVLPVPEARDAIRDIAAFIRRRLT